MSMERPPTAVRDAIRHQMQTSSNPVGLRIALLNPAGAHDDQ
jgi:hypothetical protein